MSLDTRGGTGQPCRHAGGAALLRFGTVRPKVRIPSPRPTPLTRQPILQPAPDRQHRRPQSQPMLECQTSQQPQSEARSLRSATYPRGRTQRRRQRSHGRGRHDRRLRPSLSQRRSGGRDRNCRARCYLVRLHCEAAIASQGAAILGGEGGQVRSVPAPRGARL